MTLILCALLNVFGLCFSDFPMNHYTHWIGLLLKPSQEEIEQMKQEAEDADCSEAKAGNKAKAANGEAAPAANGNAAPTEVEANK